MPDITMCSGKGCPLKEKCYRFTAKPSDYRQAYFLNPPVEKDGEDKAHCSHFWDNKEKKHDIKY